MRTLPKAQGCSKVFRKKMQLFDNQRLFKKQCPTFKVEHFRLQACIGFTLGLPKKAPKPIADGIKFYKNANWEFEAYTFKKGY